MAQTASGGIMRRILVGLGVLGLLGLGAFWLLTAPARRDMADYDGLVPDLANGAQVFWATGCASCHAAAGAKAEGRLVLSGGQRFASPFGTFLAPNISTDAQAGIGGWSLADFVHAVQDGVSPEGEHYFPAMPYAAYAMMAPQDVVDLKAFLDGLPADATPSLPHEVGFPFNIRRSLGGWKMLFTGQGFVLPQAATPDVARGRYLAEAMAHCGECHTPRNLLGGLKRRQWLGGAAMPDGKGRVPNITPAGLDWSEADILAYLTTGFTPEFDVVGGPMAHVVENMTQLPESDVRAIVAYLKAVPGVAK
jgi:mono/diheme cytochrome c family protein